MPHKLCGHGYRNIIQIRIAAAGSGLVLADTVRVFTSTFVIETFLRECHRLFLVVAVNFANLERYKTENIR